MRCEKHPNYKGLKYKKIRCSDCDRIYKEVQRKTSENGRYPSLTTPSYKFGLIGFLSELSCVMCFGDKLKPFFWRQGSEEKYRLFYTKTYSMLQGWYNKRKDSFKPLENFLYFAYTKHQKSITIDNMQKPLVVIDAKKEEIPEHIPLNINNESKLNPWEILNKENENG